MVVKIYTVCGAGIGTSVLLKSNVDRVLQELGIEADVHAVSITDAMDENSTAQIVLATPELIEKLAGVKSEVIPVNNIFDLAELNQKLTAALS